MKRMRSTIASTNSISTHYASQRRFALPNRWLLQGDLDGDAERLLPGR